MTAPRALVPALLAALAGFAVHPLARSQDTLPAARPIEFVVLFPAGTSADVTARVLAEGMSRQLGAQIVVVNRPGGGGAVGYQYAAQQAPDGHHLVWSSNAISTTYHTGTLPFDHTAFLPVARVQIETPLLFVRSEARWKSLSDLLQNAKAKPGTLTVGNSGFGSHTHLSSVWLFRAGGYQVLDVPFNAAQVVPSLLGGHVDAVVQLPGALAGHVKAGTVRALVAMSGARDRFFPDVPTAREQGYPVDWTIVRGYYMGPKVTDAEARKNGWPVAIAIVDTAGNLVLYQRHDNTQTGSVDSVRHALNTRFDMFEGNFNSKKNDSAFRPAKNVTKGYTYTGNACNPSPSTPPTAMAFPIDSFIDTNRVGNGDWNNQFGDYWAINHPGVGNPWAGGDLPTRYDVYRWEIDNNRITDNTPSGENGFPACSSIEPNDEPDRRIIYAAVLNCDDLDLTGGSGDTVPALTFIKMFITQPMTKLPGTGHTDEDDTLYVEMMGIVDPGVDDEVVHDIVQLYR